LIPSSEAPEIQGYVFTSNDLKENQGMLDKFEGQDYRRELVRVKLCTGVTVESYVYSVRLKDKR